MNDGAVDDGACGVDGGGFEVQVSFADFFAGDVEDW